MPKYKARYQKKKVNPFSQDRTAFVTITPEEDIENKELAEKLAKEATPKGYKFIEVIER